MEKMSICLTSDTCNNSFEGFPDEVMLLIFSFFDIKELCINVAPVCRHWYNLTNDPSLWLNLNISFNDHSNRTMLRFMESKTKKCNTSKELTIESSDGLTKNTLKVIVKHFCKLEVLIVKAMIDSRDSYPVFGKLKYLKHLDLSDSFTLNNDGLVAIAEQCKHLQYLNIDLQGWKYFINDESLMRLIELRGSSLTHLYLNGGAMTDKGFHALSGCMRLQHLGISLCELMTDNGILSLKGLSNLTWIKLNSVHSVTEHGLRDFFTEGKLSRLTHVDLSDCLNLNDSVIMPLLKKCPSIVNLCLNNCRQVTDVGVTEVVQNCHNMHVLELGMGQITGAPFRSLHLYLPKLSVLKLIECDSIDDTIMRQLVCDKPSLKVIDCFENELTLNGLQQHYVNIMRNEKDRKLCELLNFHNLGQVIIFINSVQHCNTLVQLLKKKFSAIEIHCAMDQKKRFSRYEKFKDEMDILVATDRFADGMNIECVETVINYDMPDSSDTYFHRVSRAYACFLPTNYKGRGITFITEESDAKILNEVKEKFGVNITELPNQVYRSSASTYATNSADSIDTIMQKLLCDKPSLKVIDCFENELTLNGLQQHYVNILKNEKDRKLCELLNFHNLGQVIIFVNSVQHCNTLVQLLKKKKFSAIEIHCAMNQKKRFSRYEKFKDEMDILVATDRFADGMNIECVETVLNYDMPDSSDTYFHRVSRAYACQGITFITEESDAKILNEVKEKFGGNITELPNQVYRSSASTYATNSA